MSEAGNLERSDRRFNILGEPSQPNDAKKARSEINFNERGSGANMRHRPTQNANLISSLMNVGRSPGDPSNLSLRYPQDGKGFKVVKRFGRGAGMIKSPCSELNTYNPAEKKGEKAQNVSVHHDFKDNISQQDLISRRMKVENENPFYDHSHQLASHDISEQNFKNSILSFKDNMADPKYSIMNVQHEDSMRMLQNLQNRPPFPNSMLGVTPSHAPFPRLFPQEPQFAPTGGNDFYPQKYEIDKLINLESVFLKKRNSSPIQINSPKIRNPAVPKFQPMFPKKGIRPSIKSHADEVLIPDNDENNKPFYNDRETQILPGYNYTSQDQNMDVSTSLYRSKSHFGASLKPSVHFMFKIEKVEYYQPILSEIYSKDLIKLVSDQEEFPRIYV